MHVEDATGDRCADVGALLHGGSAIELGLGHADRGARGAGVGARSSAGGLAGIGVALGAFRVLIRGKFAGQQILAAFRDLPGDDRLNAGRGSFAVGSGRHAALVFAFDLGLFYLRLHQFGGFGNREQLAGRDVVASFDQQPGQHRSASGFGRDGGGDLQRPLPGFQPTKCRYLRDGLRRKNQCGQQGSSIHHARCRRRFAAEIGMHWPPKGLFRSREA